MINLKNFIIISVVSSIIFSFLGLLYHHKSNSITTNLQLRVDIAESKGVNTFFREVDSVNFYLNILKKYYTNNLRKNVIVNIVDRNSVSVSSLKSKFLLNFFNRVLYDTKFRDQNTSVAKNFTKFKEQLNTEILKPFLLLPTRDGELILINVVSPLSINDSRLIVQQSLDDISQELLNRYILNINEDVENLIINIENFFKINESLIDQNIVKILDITRDQLKKITDFKNNINLYKYTFNENLTTTVKSSLKLTMLLFGLFGLVLGALISVIRQFIKLKF